ncbi:MAG: ferredoxin:glutaredoxin reductase [Elusimicrobia bacterium RIFOXYA2_FULL_39_19]|nr:MAG: ferredoxin:glutaredoxin reductase [Elusimicrobia bacterium RIFOXYA2_FULL_39_19]
MEKPTAEEIEKLYQKLKKDAQASGYYLNPDETFTKELIEGLLINEKRYGYQACPCRLAYEQKEKDLDIICPCDYRDPDLGDYDACYCGLYVSEKIVKNQKTLKSIPDRRPAEPVKVSGEKAQVQFSESLPFPVWRCKVCGYLCARGNPPEKCPICKVDKDRFEKYF